MNVTPKDSGGNSAQAPVIEQQGMQGAKARAIAAVMANQAKIDAAVQNGTPAVNATSVQPEEMSAIAATPSKAAEAPVRQTDTAETSSESKPDEPSLSSQYAQLARKEKALRAKAIADQQALKSREAEIRASVEAELKAKLESEYNTNYIPKDKFTNDTWQALLDAGLSYDKITELAMSQPQDLHPAVKATLAKLEAKVKATEDQQKKIENAAIESQKQQYAEAVRQLTSEAKQLISSSDEFETIKAYNQASEVVKLIERTYAEDNYLMTVEEAAREVENYLFDQLTKATKLKKFQKSQAGSAQPAATTETKQQPNSTQQQQKSQTLTNQVSSSRKLSGKERAILAFKGELKG